VHDRPAPARFGSPFRPGERQAANGALPAPVAPALAPGRLPRQRRPAIVALAIAVIGAATLANVAIYVHVNHKESVLAVVQPVAPGAVITAQDITTTSVEAGPAVRVIPARQLGQVTGLIAATALRPGMLLAPADVTTTSPPNPGEALVAVAVHPSAVPASGLGPGDRVNLIPTPGIPGAPGTAASGSASMNGPVPGVVEAVNLVPDQDGLDVVDVLLPSSDAANVADQASTGQLAIVLTRRAPQ
jgi:SAF domain